MLPAARAAHKAWHPGPHCGVRSACDVEAVTPLSAVRHRGTSRGAEKRGSAKSAAGGLRGGPRFRASPADRANRGAPRRAVAIVADRGADAGIAEGAADAPLRKCWRLVYEPPTSRAANPLASLGGIYQGARELPVVVNVIDSFPRLLANLPRTRLPD